VKMAQSFDAALEVPGARRSAVLKADIFIRRKNYPAEFRYYPESEEAAGHWFARVSADLPFFPKWRDDFEVRGDKRELLGRGTVLNPLSEDPRKLKYPKRHEQLVLLSGDEKDMVLAFAEIKGFQGLTEKEALGMARIDAEHLEAAARRLEEDGRARILSFSPLHVIAQSSLDFLGRKVVEFTGLFHEKHPELRGIPLDRIAKRFDLGDTVLHLALKTLLRSGEIQVLDDIIALAGFKVPLSPQEEEILEAMEKMCYEGRFSSISLDDIRQKFQISLPRLQTLLGLLTERKKIVQGKEGFYIHSRWLDEIVTRLRSSRKRELSVAEFKEMTGLSRKFAIPLLELLDEMGVTKRQGPGRVIL
jgi:selenocysteine-specific elongation factor